MLWKFLITTAASCLACGCLVGAGRVEAVEPSKPTAFPGAVGYHVEACTHGRGGRVLVVTSLEDRRRGEPAEGTFRWACETIEGPRVIVFAVGGILKLEKAIQVRPDVYIAGQTAPGDGICLSHAGLRLGSNTLVRHVRFRMGDEWPPGEVLTKRDAFEAHGRNIVLDHCSIAWTSDECFRINGGENVTISNCFFGEGLHITMREEFHNYGPSLEPNFETGGETKNLLIHRCLFNGFAARSPLIGNGDREVHLMLSNNVFYNYGGLKYPPIHTYAPKKAGKKAGAAFGRVDIVNNYFKEGPATPPGSPVVQVHGDYPTGAVFLQGNAAANRAEGNSDEWTALMADANEPGVKRRHAETAQHSLPGIELLNADAAFEQVLRNSGATFPRRDSVDERFAADIRSGTAWRGNQGSKPRNPDAPLARQRGDFRVYYDYIFEDPQKILARHDLPEKRALGLTLADLDPVPGGKEFYATFRGGEPQADQDRDGLPDAWERSRSLDPAAARDNVRIMPSGYTAIEEYVNGLCTTPSGE